MTDRVSASPSSTAPASAGEMSAGGWERALPVPPAILPEQTLSAAQWGMVAFLVSEVAFFCTLIAAYVTFLGKDKAGPTPAESLHLPLVIGTTICLLSSSVVVHLAERALKEGNPLKFRACWAGTILLGITFLLGTAYEWHALIEHEHLTISRNLFGSTYYTLVGFHGLHVTAGVIAMLVVLGVTLGREITAGHSSAVQLVSWYWHFVDAVWVVVFLVVYV